MKQLLRKWFQVVFILLFSSLVTAKDFEVYFENTEPLGQSILTFLSHSESLDPQTVNAYFDLLVSQEKSWTNGLKAVSTFQSNGKNIGVDDEYLSYRKRLAVGVRWDVLKNGFIKGEVNAQKADLERQEALVNLMKQEYVISSNAKRLYIEQLFWKEMSHIKSVEYLILKELASWSAKAYTQNQITELEYELAQKRLLRLEKSAYVNDSLSLDSAISVLPEFSVNRDYLDNLNFLMSEEQVLIDQEKSLIDKSSSRMYDISLTPNVRYNIFDENGKGFSAAYVSYGLNLEVPFSVIKKKPTQFEKNTLQSNFDIEKSIRAQKVVSLFHQLYRFNEEVEINIDRITRIQIENNGKQGEYNNVKTEYYNRLLDMIDYKKRICTQKRNAFNTLISIIELTQDDTICDHIMLY